MTHMAVPAPHLHIGPSQPPALTRPALRFCLVILDLLGCNGPVLRTFPHLVLCGCRC